MVPSLGVICDYSPQIPAGTRISPRKLTPSPKASPPRHHHHERRRRHHTPSSSEEKEPSPPPKRKKPETDPLTTRTGGAYIPPARLRMMQEGITDKNSVAYQRIAWEALKKSINGLVNKVWCREGTVLLRAWDFALFWRWSRSFFIERLWAGISSETSHAKLILPKNIPPGPILSTKMVHLTRMVRAGTRVGVFTQTAGF